MVFRYVITQYYTIIMKNKVVFDLSGKEILLESHWIRTAAKNWKPE
jgi:hypothetical protein